MKSVLFSILFSTISLLSFAQKPFTEQLMLDMNKRLVQDPVAFFKTEVSPNYTLIGDQGQVITYQQVMGVFEQNTFSAELSDVKVSQHGNIGIATGITNHGFKNKTNGATASYKERFTYIHEFKNGKWQILSGQHSPIQVPASEDEAAIKKALDDETTTFHTNPQEITKHWKLDDKTFMMGTWDDGKFMMFDAEKLKAALKTLTPQNSKGVKSNHRINIKGNIAIVDFDQVTTATDGSKGYQHNLCLLEKTNGEWKFIGSSIYKTTGL